MCPVRRAQRVQTALMALKPVNPARSLKSPVPMPRHPQRMAQVRQPIPNRSTCQSAPGAQRASLGACRNFLWIKQTYPYQHLTMI